MLWNPASELELPRIERRLPQYVLTAEEAEQVLERPDVNQALGVRDRAMLEVLYSTGIRRTELANLSVYDLDVERGTLFVRQGKGKKDRMVPIGERAIAWVRRYLEEVRPRVVMPPDAGRLFLTSLGEEFSPHGLTQLVRDYVTAAETGKKGACHLFRHTMATLMLENGADIRFIQEMLGHAELSTTQIYTQVSIRKLQAVHALTHPTARLGRAEMGFTPTLPLVATPELEHPELAKTTVEPDVVFSRLAAEDDETTEGDAVTAQSESALDVAVAPPARRSRSGQRSA